jgi:hypothetical protein
LPQTTVHAHRQPRERINSGIGSDPNFITDLNNQNLGNDVVAATFSEFGKGTPWQKINLMFLFEYNRH